MSRESRLHVGNCLARDHLLLTCFVSANCPQIEAETQGKRYAHTRFSPFITFSASLSWLHANAPSLHQRLSINRSGSSSVLFWSSVDFIFSSKHGSRSPSTILSTRWDNLLWMSCVQVCRQEVCVSPYVFVCHSSDACYGMPRFSFERICFFRSQAPCTAL